MTEQPREHIADLYDADDIPFSVVRDYTITCLEYGHSGGVTLPSRAHTRSMLDLDPGQAAELAHAVLTSAIHGARYHTEWEPYRAPWIADDEDVQRAVDAGTPGPATVYVARGGIVMNIPGAAAVAIPENQMLAAAQSLIAAWLEQQGL